MNLKNGLEFLDLTVPQVPPRSTLFHLDPMGVSTPYIESLSSYISRLALEHFIKPHHLMSKIVAPLFDKKIGINRGGLANYGMAINGLGNTSAKLIAVFEKLTLRNDLRFTTMLPWAEVLPDRHLIRQHRAWCGACYNDWRESGQVIYDPLIWAIRPVTVCHKHLRYLESTCTHCNCQLHHLLYRSIPGYCPNCRYWLGVATGQSYPLISEDDLMWQAWVHENIGNLFTEAPRLISPPTRVHIAKSLSRLLKTLHIHQYRGLMVSLGIAQGTLYKWRAGKNLPHLSWLLRLCFQMKVRLVDTLCLEAIIDENAESVLQLEAEVGKQNRYKHTYKPIDHVRTEKQLLVASEEFPPRSLNQVALQIGICRIKVKHLFPKLCQKIVINPSC